MSDDKHNSDDDIPPEYDLAAMGSGKKGKHLESYCNGTNLAKLAPDVRKAFASDESVNEALRSLMPPLQH